ncbi:hypothetical protein JZ751_029447 [Albula glossodonta]|uniref:Uncharacterized protein n=1 Tax=Albula glossodonta TaxID=121402 RepID=A0A8T2PJN5_9TELE|nr:hypothetical protein JZ751_029447 [Albula glossodonta]
MELGGALGVAWRVFLTVYNRQGRVEEAGPFCGVSTEHIQPPNPFHRHGPGIENAMRGLKEGAKVEFEVHPSSCLKNRGQETDLDELQVCRSSKLHSAHKACQSDGGPAPPLRPTPLREPPAPFVSLIHVGHPIR